MSNPFSMMISTLVPPGTVHWEEKVEVPVVKRTRGRVVYWTDAERNLVYSEVARLIFCSPQRHIHLENKKVVTPAMWTLALSNLVRDGKLGKTRIRAYQSLANAKALGPIREGVKEKLDAMLAAEQK